MSTVIGTATHPVDLSDGRSLGPGEVAEDVDTTHPHQRALVVEGQIAVLEGSTPRTAPTAEQLTAAAEKDREALEAAASDEDTDTTDAPAQTTKATRASTSKETAR